MTTPLDLGRSGHIVFVYGTLRRGGDASTLLADCEYLGETTIAGTLHDLGPYPALRLGGNASVQGEIWRCSAETLERLDSYEGVQEGLFSRVRIDLDLGPVWTYVAGPALHAQIAKAPRVLSGRWPA